MRKVGVASEWDARPLFYSCNKVDRLGDALGIPKYSAYARGGQTYPMTLCTVNISSDWGFARLVTPCALASGVCGVELLDAAKCDVFQVTAFRMPYQDGMVHGLTGLAHDL